MDGEIVYQSSTSFLSFSANICFPEEYLDDFPDSVTYVAYTINCGNTGMGTGLNINDDEEYDISIYPNPSSKYINVNIDTKLEAVVFDLLGKELIRENITGRLDISSLEKGYILKTQTKFEKANTITIYSLVFTCHEENIWKHLMQAYNREFCYFKWLYISDNKYLLKVFLESR